MYTVKGKSDKDHLLEQHAPLVKKLAHHMKAKLPANVEVDDLVQAGMMGLLDAVNRYEENHGAQFETYATLRIRGAMLDELRSSDWLPRGVRQNMRKIEFAMSSLQQLLGHSPSESEVAKFLKLSLVDYQEMLNEGGGHQLLYYEDFHDVDGNEHFLDRYSIDEDSDPLQTIMNSDFRQSLVDAINRLPEREKVLMGLYYEQELNLKEIGAVMGVSESRVCQLHSQAVSRLRSSLRE
jgi:RNA polymerase sigma factor FliA